jgi:hypothetical protein
MSRLEFRIEDTMFLSVKEEFKSESAWDYYAKHNNARNSMTTGRGLGFQPIRCWQGGGSQSGGFTSQYTPYVLRSFAVPTKALQMHQIDAQFNRQYSTHIK